MSARSWRIVAAVGIFGALAGILISRWVTGQPEDPVIRMAREGAALYATFEMAPIESAEGVLAVLREQADYAADISWSDGLRDSFLRANAEFLWCYFGEATPDAYLAWRGAKYVPRSREELFNPPPQLSSAEEALRQHWRNRSVDSRGVNLAVEHAADPRGLLVVAGEVTQSHQHLPPSEGQLGIEYWHGGIGYAGRSWWKPNRAIERERFLSARLSIVMGFADGTRRPLLIQWHHDERSNDWLLHSLHIHNAVDAGIVNIDF